MMIFDTSIDTDHAKAGNHDHLARLGRTMAVVYEQVYDRARDLYDPRRGAQNGVVHLILRDSRSACNTAI